MLKQTLIKIIDIFASILAIPTAILRPVAIRFNQFMQLIKLRAASTGNIPVSTQFDGPIRPVNHPNLSLDNHCRFGRDVVFETGPDGQIKLGKNVRVNAGTTIVSYANIYIADDCLIGEYVSIRDADHGLAPDQLIRNQPHNSKPILIEQDVWVGRGSVILKGVTLGKGSVVAANSVVTHDVPPMTIVGGVPAKTIKQRGDQ